MRDELRYISDSLEPAERIKKAFRLVASTTGSQADAYSIMQWVTVDKTPNSDISDTDLLKAQNEMRRLMGLKEK